MSATGAPAACMFRFSGARAALRIHRCGRCKSEYADEAWHALEVVDRIVAARVRGLVTAWPDDVAIEIRRCRTCSGPIARKQAPTQRSEAAGSSARGAGAP